jgi:hypothetical protein
LTADSIDITQPARGFIDRRNGNTTYFDAIRNLTFQLILRLHSAEMSPFGPQPCLRPSRTTRIPALPTVSERADFRYPFVSSYQPPCDTASRIVRSALSVFDLRV